MPCLFPVLIAAACAEAPPQPFPAARPLPISTLVARGTEPFWSLRIHRGVARFETPDRPGATTLAVRASPVRNGVRYDGRGIRADFTNAPCSDGMSERRYSMRVRLVVAGRRYAGCADTVLPATALVGQTFAVTAVDAMPAPGDRTARGPIASLTFNRARLNGNTGCNSINGPWRAEGGRLVAGPLAMTRRACTGPGMRFEARMAELLGQPLDVIMLTGGRWQLVAGEGGSITIAQQR